MEKVEAKSLLFVFAIMYILFAFWAVMTTAIETLNVVNDTNKNIEQIIGNGK